MKFRPDKKNIHRGIIALVVIILSICFYYLLFHGAQLGTAINHISGIIMPIIYGTVFAYLLTPIVNNIEKYLLKPFSAKMMNNTKRRWKKISRIISITLSLTLSLLAIYGFFSLIIPELIGSIQSISKQLPAFVTSTTNVVNKFGADYPDIMNFVQNNLTKYSVEIQSYLNTSIIPQLETVVKSVSLSLLGLLGIVWNLLVGIIISCYVLYNKELFAGQVKKIIYAIFKTPTANNFIKNCRFTNKTFGGYISGKIIDSILIGFLCFAGVSILNTPYPVLISVVVGVTNIIPFFGPYLGAIPCAFLILMVNPLQSLYFLIFILILQQLDGNILEPRILGESTGLSGFWVIFSIIVFGGIFGITGMIIGVPIFAVLYTGIRGYVNNKLSVRGLSTKTVDYLDVESIENNVFIQNKPRKKNNRGIFANKNNDFEASSVHSDETKSIVLSNTDAENIDIRNIAPKAAADIGDSNPKAATDISNIDSNNTNIDRTNIDRTNNNTNNNSANNNSTNNNSANNNSTNNNSINIHNNDKSTESGHKNNNGEQR